MERWCRPLRDARWVPSLLWGDGGGDIRSCPEGQPEISSEGLPLSLTGGQGPAQEDALQGHFSAVLGGAGSQ